MASGNLHRLIKLADEVFAVKNDPDQLDVNQQVIDRLLSIHPSTVSEYANADGPVAWILIIPSTIYLMQLFLEKKISEKELFELTQADETYDALYLCSALVLPEFQRKGIAKRLILAAIENIQKDHPIKCLFAWPFSKEGDLISETIASLTSLPLFKRQDH
jgi:GNAT superfamily N-acetyltransferase